MPFIQAYTYNVYDAVWTVALALNDMKVNGDNLTPPAVTCVQCDQNTVTKWPHGQALLAKIKAVSLSFCLSVGQSVYLSVRPSFFLSVCLSVCGITQGYKAL